MLLAANVNKCVDNIKSRRNILSLQKETLGVIALNFRENITFYLRQLLCNQLCLCNRQSPLRGGPLRASLAMQSNGV